MQVVCLISIATKHRATQYRQRLSAGVSKDKARLSNASHPFELRTLVMQPTSQCNIDCSYCYLGDRQTARKMSIEVAAKVAQHLKAHIGPVDIVWHGGEPLMVGAEYFRLLLREFEALRQSKTIRHAIQTNGILISEKWCDLFQEYDVHVGVSLDGPSWANANRVDKRHRGTFEKVLNGISTLRKRGIPFGIICVITEQTATRASELYSFFLELGCRSLAINIVERDGYATQTVVTQTQVRDFWRDLIQAWRENPALEIREFRHVIRWVTAMIDHDMSSYSERAHDWAATIDTNGNVSVLSPELSGLNAPAFNNFIVGNAIQNDLTRILLDAEHASYVQDFARGKTACKQSCSYYSFCYGGHASNKYAETGRFDATETEYCMNSKKSLLDISLKVLAGRSAREEFAQ